MKPVLQTTFGIGTGNCFSACIASLLEVPIEEVPFFMGEDDPMQACDAWLARFGFYLLRRWMPQPLPTKELFEAIDELDGQGWPRGFYILAGLNAGGPHTVVAQDTKIVHDPNPAHGELVVIECAMMLVPLDPARVKGPAALPGPAHKNEPPAMGSPAAPPTPDRSEVGCP